MSATKIVYNLLVIRAKDLNLASEFYRALGMEFVRHCHGTGPEHLASETAGQVFEIYPLGTNDSPTTSVRFGFAVPSVDEAFQATLAAGGQRISPPNESPWGRRAVVADPDGHRIELLAK